MKKLLLLGALLACSLPGNVSAQGHPATGRPAITSAYREKADSWLKNDKSGFVENKGQLKDQASHANAAVRYLLQMPGLNVQLRPTGFSYDTWADEKTAGADAAPVRKFHRVDIELEGANPHAAMTAGGQLAGVKNVFNENGSFEGIHSFRKVTYQNIYPGIDLEFVAEKGTDKPVEYNFIVHPGADAAQIKMKYSSGSDISLKNGMIEMALAFGTLKEKIPASYTQQDGRSLAVQYRPLDETKDLYAFNVPTYDHSQTLVIDPTPSLVWSTYYGGSGNEFLYSIDADAAGNIYICGPTTSTSNIATAGAYQTVPAASSEHFIAKFTAAGVRQWGTYIGGDIAVNNPSQVRVSGNYVYLAGSTATTGLATVGQTTYGGGTADGYLCKVNAADGFRVWATYYGGTATDNLYAVFPDANGGVYVAGSAGSATGIATPGAFQATLSGTTDGFIGRFDASGAQVWGTYLGGTGGEQVRSLAVDAAGNVYAVGYTSSTTGLSTAGAFQQTYAGGAFDMFLAKIDNTGANKLWCTYWGGDGAEIGYAVKIDPSGNLVVVGSTGTLANITGSTSSGLASAGAMHTGPLGGRDVLIGKFSPSGSRLWATYYGGPNNDMVVSADLDENGNILIAGDGYTSSPSSIAGNPSTGLATNCTWQPSVNGGNEAFISKIAAGGNSVLWSTYFGAAADERAFAIKYLGNGSFVMGGTTSSTSGMGTAGAHQAAGGGTNDGYFARFTDGTAPVDVAVTASTISPMTQTACALGVPATITGNTVSLYNPPGFTSPIFYQWQSAGSATGPWTNMGGEVFKDLQPLPATATQYYRRLVSVNNGFCDTKVVDSSAVATVNVNSSTAPVANADGPQWYVCGSGANTVTLNGSATGGSGVYSGYEWYAGSNLTTPVAATASFTPAVTAVTTYTLKVTDNAGCIDVDQVAVVPAIANAGADVSMCENSGGVQIGAAGIPGGSVTYSWTSLSGSPVSSLSCTNCAQPIASPSATTTYQLTTTVTEKDGSTCSTTDDVTVTFVTAPAGGAGFGGTDKTICKSTTVVLGGVNDASATYSWSPASYLSAGNIYNPTFDAGTSTVPCPIVYTVTAVKGGCSFTDQVSVSVIDPATSLDNQATVCGSWSFGNTHNCSGATYSWQLVSGPGVVPAGASLVNGGADAYLVNTGAVNAVYHRTTSLNGVDCISGDITVAPCGGGGGGCPVATIKMSSPQGCPKVFGPQDLQLYVDGINANDYYFSWTPASIMDNPAAPAVTISATTAATVNVTLTNKYTGQTCTVPSLAINDPAWALPVLSVSNVATCPGTPVAIGETATAGFSYTWSPATGLNLPNASNPIASLNASTNYHVTKTDNASGCLTTATVAVTVQDIVFDAGPDHSVCNGATVTLGTTPGGSYTYSWTPTNAAWTNGTGPADANPQVLFASASQTFNVTVTNTVTGCQKTDTVTLSGVTNPGEYAGPAIGPLCPGATAQLGVTPVVNAGYSWSPATGLSCTACANPTVTAGTATQVYSVTVSYPGCTVPVTDSVTVSVNSLPTVTFADKNICSSTPENIGIGGTGNTASLPSAASYQWSPATALSCANCASPNANPVAVTTYTATITLTNGCIVTDDVTVTPIVQATAKPDATICPGGSAVLGSPSVANVAYAWTILSGTAGSVSPTNTAQPTANPTVTSVYRLTATGIGPNAGCTVTDDVQVTVKTLPVFSITGNTSVCSGSSTTLSVNPSTANIIYQWSPAAGAVSPDSSSTVVMPTANTTYRVTQTDLNSGCSSYQEAIVTVWPNNVTATGGNMTVCPATSAIMPLTITPATGTTIVWSPAVNLSNAYAQNPIVTPLSGGQYIATVTDNASSCSDTALVTVTVPASCTGSDYGDAPAVYENGNPASHGIDALIKIGAATDAEGSAVSAVMNAPAVGDDNNSTINDEEGISFLPGVNTSSKTIGALVNNVLNNTGSPAYLVAWIDFNRDGDFNDAGEQSSIVTLASSAAAANPLLQFSGFNTGCAVTSGPSYLRVRLTADTTGGWNINPLPNGSRTSGEVEDYAITIYGNDYGDAPLMYTVANAGVNPDLNNDGEPDAAGSVWLGSIVDYASCDPALSNLVDGDDNSGMSDEDGLNMNGGIATPNTTATWDLTVNSQGAVSNVQWGMWIDWNADGVFDDFFHDSVNTASPVIVPVTVTSPANMALNYVVRAGVKTGTAFAADQYNLRISNGEWEDFIAAPIPLDVTLLSFTATKQATAALLQWKTAREAHSDYFVVERSADARVWAEAGRVTAAVKSETELNYSMTDYQPLQGTNYYRLRMVDKDGSYKLGPVRQLTFGKDAVVVTVMPNPAHGMATVVFSAPTREAVSMKLIDGFGRLVAAYEVPAGTTHYPVPLETVARGMYYLDVKDEAIQAHLKLVVQ